MKKSDNLDKKPKTVPSHTLIWDPELEAEKDWLDQLISSPLMGICLIDNEGHVVNKFDIHNSGLREHILQYQRSIVGNLALLHQESPALIKKDRLSRQKLVRKHRE